MPRKTEKLFRIFKRISMFPQTIDEIYQWTLSQEMNISKRTLYRYLDDIESFLSDGRHEVVAKLNKSNQKQWLVVDRNTTNLDAKQNGADGFLLLTTIGPDHLSKVSSIVCFDRPASSDNQRSSQTNVTLTRPSKGLLLKTGFGESTYAEKHIRIFSRICECIEQSLLAEISFSKLFASQMGLKAQKQFVPLSFVNHDGGFYVALKPKGKGSLFFAPLECLESFRNTGHHAESGVSTADIKHRIEKSFGMSTGPHRFYDVELSFEFKDGEYAPAYDPEVVMRKNWHHGQHFTTRANGECIMRFRASLNSDLLHWILGMADNVTIRKPEKLKLMYRSLLDQMVAKSRN